MQSEQPKTDADTEVPSQPQRMITLRLSEEQHSQVANAAKCTGFSLNSYILIRLGFEIEPIAGKIRGRKPQPR